MFLIKVIWPKFYFLPKFSWGMDRSLWFFDVRWLCLQLCLYSIEMGDRIVKEFDKARKRLSLS